MNLSEYKYEIEESGMAHGVSFYPSRGDVHAVDSEESFSRLSSLLETFLGPQLKDEFLVQYFAMEVFLYADDRTFKMIERCHTIRGISSTGDDLIEKSSTLFGVPHAVAGEPSRSRLVPMKRFWPAIPDLWTASYESFYDARGIYPPGKLVSRRVGSFAGDEGHLLFHDLEIAGEEPGTIVRVYMRETMEQKRMCSRRVVLSRHICRMPISPFARYENRAHRRGVIKRFETYREPEGLGDVLCRKFPEVYHNYPETECVDFSGRIVSRKWNIYLDTGDAYNTLASFSEIYAEDGDRIVLHIERNSNTIMKMPEAQKKICHYGQKEPF